MAIFLAIAAAFGIIGGLAGLMSWVKAEEQIKLMKQYRAEQQNRDDEENSWAQRFENLQRKLLRINPNLQVREPGQQNTTWIYTTMYPDPKFRVNVESFIVELNSSLTAFKPRKPQPHEFSSSTMRETIQQAEKEMEEFVKEHAFCKQHLYG